MIVETLVVASLCLALSQYVSPSTRDVARSLDAFGSTNLRTTFRQPRLCEFRPPVAFPRAFLDGCANALP